MALEAQENPFPYVTMEEVLADGSETTPNPAADFRKLFLGEDGLLYTKDSAGTVALAGAGGLSDPMTTRGDIIVRNASNVTARLARGSADTYLGSDGTDVAYSAVTDAKLSTSDITTNNASTTKHGFLKKLDNTATNYMDGTGNWSAPAGGGGGSFVWLQRQTASTSAQLDFTSFISSTYDIYRFDLFGCVPVTDNTNFGMRVGTGGGPTYDSGTNYAASGMRWSNTGSAVAGSASGTSFGLDVSGGIDNGAGRGITGHVILYMPMSTSPAPRMTAQVGYTDNTNVPLGATSNGQYNGGSAITAVRFFMASGSISVGTIDVYGLKHV